MRRLHISLAAVCAYLFLTACGESLTETSDVNTTGAAGGSAGGSETGGSAGGAGNGGNAESATCTLPPNLPAFIDLPAVYVDTSMPEQTGSVMNVAAGESVQNAIDNAQPGDTIVLEAGVTWTEEVHLKDKGGSSDWIVIQSSAMDALPGAGERVSPADAANMPTILSPSGNNRALVADRNAHHYRIMGVEFGIASGENVSLGIIELGRNKEAGEWIPVDEQPHHIVLDRVYVRGIPEPVGSGSVGTKYGVLFGGAHLAVINSHIADIKKVQQDTYAIGSNYGSGPYRIVNNYLAAAGENILFGGGDTPDGGYNAADVEICRNHFHKPLEWYDPRLNYNSKWSVKNLLELKHGHRVVISGNVFENNWAAAQTGWSLLFRSTDQGGGNNNDHQKTEDVVLVYNLITNVTNGIDINGRGSGDNNTGPTSDFYIAHNVIDKMGSQSTFGGNGFLLMVDKDPPNVQFVNNTAFNIKTYLTTNCTGDGQTCSTDWPHALVAFQLRDNIISYGTPGYGVHGPGGSTDEEQFANATDSESALENNVIALGKSSQYPSETNFIVDDFEAVGFADLEGGDYRLSDDSPFRGATPSGADIGADVETWLQAIDGVR